jgi:hypothetical protein
MIRQNQIIHKIISKYQPNNNDKQTYPAMKEIFLAEAPQAEKISNELQSLESYGPQGPYKRSKQMRPHFHQLIPKIMRGYWKRYMRSKVNEMHPPVASPCQSKKILLQLQADTKTKKKLD